MDLSLIANAAYGLELGKNYEIVPKNDFFLAKCHGHPNILNPSAIINSFSK